MLAISERIALSEPVTEALIAGGDRVVVHAVAGNPGARFADSSVTTLVTRARADEALQTLLRQRDDLPEAHMQQLLAIAKEAARKRLAETLPHANPPALDAAVERSASTVEAAVAGGRDYRPALAAVQALADHGPLAEKDLSDFAERGRREEAVCAIALLTGLGVPAAERLFSANETDLLLVVGKAQGWAWPTVRALVKLRDEGEATPARLKKAFETYEQLAPGTAQRVMHFLKVRESAQKKAAEAVRKRIGK